MKAAKDMTGGERVAWSMSLSNMVRNIIRSYIIERHPDFSREQISQEMIRVIYGEELHEEIFGKKQDSPEEGISLYP